MHRTMKNRLIRSLFIYLGLYIPFNCKDVPPMYRGFASRIEDDVLLTKQGFEVLSSMCPKEIDGLHRILDDRDKSGMQ